MNVVKRFQQLTGTRQLFVAGYALVVAVIVGAILWAVFIRPGQNHRATVTANAGREVAEGQVRLGRDVNEKLQSTGDRDRAADEQTRESINDIKAAPGADAPLAGDLGARARRAICLRRSRGDKPTCRAL